MPIRIGINGFGRMGRLALREGWDAPDLAFVHVNEIAGGAEAAAHLLNFDSVHGRWRREARVAGDHKRSGEILRLLAEHRATELAYARAVEYAERAKECLLVFPPGRERDALAALPDYVLSRDR